MRSSAWAAKRLAGSPARASPSPQPRCASRAWKYRPAAPTRTWSSSALPTRWPRPTGPPRRARRRARSARKPVAFGKRRPRPSAAISENTRQSRASARKRRLCAWPRRARFRPRRRGKSAEHAQQRAQPPQRDAHLVDRPHRRLLTPKPASSTGNVRGFPAKAAPIAVSSVVSAVNSAASSRIAAGAVSRASASRAVEPAAGGDAQQGRDWRASGRGDTAPPARRPSAVSEISRTGARFSSATISPSSNAASIIAPSNDSRRVARRIRQENRAQRPFGGGARNQLARFGRQQFPLRRLVRRGRLDCAGVRRQAQHIAGADAPHMQLDAAAAKFAGLACRSRPMLHVPAQFCRAAERGVRGQRLELGGLEASEQRRLGVQRPPSARGRGEPPSTSAGAASAARRSRRHRSRLCA